MVVRGGILNQLSSAGEEMKTQESQVTKAGSEWQAEACQAAPVPGVLVSCPGAHSLLGLRCLFKSCQGLSGWGGVPSSMGACHQLAYTSSSLPLFTGYPDGQHTPSGAL